MSGISFLKGRDRRRGAQNSDQFLNMKAPPGMDAAAKLVAGAAISGSLGGNLIADIAGDIAADAAFTPRKGPRARKKRFL